MFANLYSPHYKPQALLAQNSRGFQFIRAFCYFNRNGAILTVGSFGFSTAKWGKSYVSAVNSVLEEGIQAGIIQM